MKLVSAVIAREGAYSIEFCVDSRRRTLGVGFWEGKQFVCMPMLHCGRTGPPAKSYVDLMSRLLSAISGDATIICCGGSSADFVKALDTSPGRKTGVQYPFILTPLQFERLLHKPSFSVMGRIDMCNLVIGLASFDYAVLFNLPKTVAVDCYQHLFQSFSSRGWVARQLRNVHIDDYVEFMDDVRHVYLDELGVGPDVEDMVSFLSSCPESSRREYTWELFKLCCLCLDHVYPNMPDVSLGSNEVGVTSVDLSSVIEPIQGYLLSSDSGRNFFTRPGSVLPCMELLETFSDRAFRCDYNPWESVNVHEYEKIRSELEKSFEAVRVASDLESSSSLSEPVFVSEKLLEQRRRPAQRPRIDIGKTHHSRVAELLAGKLRS